MKIWKLLSKQKPAPPAPIPLDQALLQAQAALAGAGNEAPAHLALAHSLLRAMGENPETLENQVLAHRMALEQIKLGQRLSVAR